jgi:Glycine rich protein
MKRVGSQTTRKALAFIFFLATFSVNPSANAALYSFTNHTFTNCSATGNTGPSQASCRSAYSTTWDESDSNFTALNGIQRWTVPASGTYRIRAIGATGGGTGAGYYGYGASIQGEFTLSQGEVLKILVGQQGLANGGGYGQGGGGGTFVTSSSDSILVIAGGGGSMGNGGGDAGSLRTARACGDASLTTSGNAGCTYSAAPSDSYGVGGTNGGSGGESTAAWKGYPGSGFTTDALAGGAKSWANGSAGGNDTTYAVGGFGGGGSAGMYGGSGGGGYSGGGASPRHSHGGGGGSFNSGTNKVEALTSSIAQGSVVITLVSIAISDTTTTLALPSSFTYRIPTNLVATVTAPGKVTFFANGKRIGGCINISTISSSGITATCSYKPSLRGQIQISATFTPSDTSAYRPSSSGRFIAQVTSRGSRR